MKATKITYGASTLLIALMMAFSAYSYFTNPMLKQAFQHLGFPDYFRIELAVAKGLGAVLLAIPLYVRLKEWVYAGFAITFVSAFIAHSASGDPVRYSLMPVMFLIVLAVSYATYHKIQAANRVVVA